MTTAPSTGSIDPRQERGLTIAKTKAKAFKQISANLFAVPSQSVSGAVYVVNVTASTCTCPDFEDRGLPCKHQFAVKYHRREIAMPDGSTVVTESVRLTYRQDWSAYNRAQCEEKDHVQILLGNLVEKIEQPVQKMGRPRMPLKDVVFAATMKVFGGLSGRRSQSDVRALKAAGHVDRVPAYNTVFKSLERPELYPLLKSLVDESARPLAAIESQFAVDATGFATQNYVRWFDHKHGEDRRVQQWVKCHCMIGTLTNVITAVEVTGGHVGDSTQFESLVRDTEAAGFEVREVSADKAYLSHANLAVVEAVGGLPYVPFKSNSVKTGSPAWERMYHTFALRKDEFLAKYHRRSNVESTFSAMKRKFGSAVRAKTQAAQFNEVLLKCLCFNLSTLVHSIHEFGIDPDFSYVAPLRLRVAT